MPAWFDAVARDLPWRRTNDPYRIWISEIMLQQTRVDQAVPYYERFLAAFPTVHALAEADLDDVLRRWEGLGYYARARHLHRAARTIVERFGGRVPDTYDAIRTLPGIGPYTAAAVLSLAYGRSHAVLDGNVARVLARVFTVADDVKATATRRRLQTLADALIDPEQPGRFNEAMMELGATVCTPTAPRCSVCPLRPVCGAFAEGRPEAYPVTKKKAPVPHHDIAVGVLFNEAGEVLIQRRPEDAMLGGLWEFPGGKREPNEPLHETCRRELHEELGIEVSVGERLCRIDHAYSHFKITLHAFRCALHAGTPTSRTGQPLHWVAVEALGDYAFPRANRRLIEHLRSHPFQPSLFG
ncbi:MAG: A/G-specific adenine glycosylase [Bacteroidetes bacterium]|nr:MAG: A/G-specific adenine glycosylase [Bacteroidota bacterium]